VPAEPPATGRGYFITFEGGEGAGKTTQLERLALWLEAGGLEVVRTREPGGTPGAEAVRRLLVEGAAERWLPSTELLLVAAARDDHLARLIRPALARGAWVLCDRYIDSTFAYQASAGGLDPARIHALHEVVLDAPLPDLTLLLDLPVETGLARRHAEGASTRFDAREQAFHERVRRGFLDRAAAAPERIAIVDAARAADDVAADMRRQVTVRLGLVAP
jgi:dTMP kinase